MIRFRSLTKRFSGVLALDDVTLDFPNEGIVSILGPNGAGKSTLINVLTGFEKPDRGEWFFGSINLSRLAPWTIARIGVSRTFQRIRLAESLTALENVRLGERRGSESLWNALTGERARAKPLTNIAILDTLELSDSSRPVGELSFGQRKLVSLACCVASGARVLVLDEPVAGVHPVKRSRIAATLRHFASLKKLVILVEHDLDFVREVSDEVVLMNSGSIVRHGSANEIFDDPKNLLDVFTH